MNHLFLASLVFGLAVGFSTLAVSRVLNGLIIPFIETEKKLAPLLRILSIPSVLWGVFYYLTHS